MSDFLLLVPVPLHLLAPLHGNIIIILIAVISISLYLTDKGKHPVIFKLNKNAYYILKPQIII